MKSLHAMELLPGMRLALPFKRTATIETVSVGRIFTTLTYKEDIPKARIENYDEVLIED